MSDKLLVFFEATREELEGVYLAMTADPPIDTPLDWALHTAIGAALERKEREEGEMWRGWTVSMRRSSGEPFLHETERQCRMVHGEHCKPVQVLIIPLPEAK